MNTNTWTTVMSVLPGPTVLPTVCSIRSLKWTLTMFHVTSTTAHKTQLALEWCRHSLLIWIFSWMTWCQCNKVSQSYTDNTQPILTFPLGDTHETKYQKHKAVYILIYASQCQDLMIYLENSRITSFGCGRHCSNQVSQSAESLAVLKRRLNSCYFTQHWSLNTINSELIIF